MNEDESPFGPVIFKYTRADAIRDGVLVRLDELTVLQAGFKIPAVITERLHNTIKSADKGGWVSYQGVIWDILNCMRFASKGLKGRRTDRVYFKVKIASKVHDLYAVCHGDDEGKPCLTIMFQDED